MNREEARAYINSNPQGHLQPAKEKAQGKPSYICPLCGHGKGGDGLTSKDGVHYHCFSCGFHGDMVELIAQEQGIADGGSAEAFEAARRVYGIDVDNTQYTHKTYSTDKPQQTEKPKTDYTSFYKAAAANLKNTDYHRQRGISDETAARFTLGYVEEWRSPAATAQGYNIPASPRLIIPTGKHSYLARDTRQLDKDSPAYKYRKQQEGAKVTFNSRALREAKQPVFVVEGELDALSIIEAGRDAVAICSTNRAKAFLQELTNQPPAQLLLLALDTDEAGEKATAELIQGLQKLKIPFTVVDIVGEHKDANEALTADREAFIKTVQTAAEYYSELDEEARAEYLKSSIGDGLQGFIDRIKRYKPCIPTGFEKLDKALDGGLYEGLIVLGAITGLGKTTFALNVIDNIAAAGKDVLLFCLEMSADEMTAKSISRITAQACIEKNISTNNAKSTRGILDYKRYAGYDPTERELIQGALQQYQQMTQGRLWIVQGIGNIGVEQVRQAVLKHYSLTGNYPVVVVDYLQLLAPYNERYSDKQNTDKAVLELKRISRDFQIPVIAISSLNRDNYTAPINAAALKESGAIEYSSDLVIGLQYTGMEYQKGEKDGERQTRIRALMDAADEKGKAGQSVGIDLKILKNRNGGKGLYTFNFYPLFNLFTET